MNDDGEDLRQNLVNLILWKIKWILIIFHFSFSILMNCYGYVIWVLFTRKRTQGRISSTQSNLPNIAPLRHAHYMHVKPALTYKLKLFHLFINNRKWQDISQPLTYVKLIWKWLALIYYGESTSLEIIITC